MASIENIKDYKKAHKQGWRTFRIRKENSTTLKGEIICPASKEAGKRLDCLNCKACNGGNKNKASVTIIAHGPLWKKQRLEKLLK